MCRALFATHRLELRLETPETARRLHPIRLEGVQALEELCFEAFLDGESDLCLLTATDMKTGELAANTTSAHLHGSFNEGVQSLSP